MSDRGDELGGDFVGRQPQRRNSGKRAAAARSTGLRHPLHQPRFGAILRNALQMLNNRNTWHPERFATLRKSMQFVRLELEIRCSIQLSYQRRYFAVVQRPADGRKSRPCSTGYLCNQCDAGTAFAITKVDAGCGA